MLPFGCDMCTCWRQMFASIARSGPGLPHLQHASLGTCAGSCTGKCVALCSCQRVSMQLYCSVFRCLTVDAESCHLHVCVCRYQYIALIYFLEFGRWPAPLRGAAGDPSPVIASEWGPWSQFYQGEAACGLASVGCRNTPSSSVSCVVWWLQANTTSLTPWSCQCSRFKQGRRVSARLQPSSCVQHAASWAPVAPPLQAQLRCLLGTSSAAASARMHSMHQRTGSTAMATCR